MLAMKEQEVGGGLVQPPRHFFAQNKEFVEGLARVRGLAVVEDVVVEYLGTVGVFRDVPNFVFSANFLEVFHQGRDSLLRREVEAKDSRDNFDEVFFLGGQENFGDVLKKVHL